MIFSHNWIIFFHTLESLIDIYCKIMWHVIMSKNYFVSKIIHYMFYDKSNSHIDFYISGAPSNDKFWHRWSIKCDLVNKSLLNSFDNMISFSKLHNFSFPYLIDEKQNIAKEFGAVCTQTGTIKWLKHPDVL